MSFAFQTPFFTSGRGHVVIRSLVRYVRHVNYLPTTSHCYEKQHQMSGILLNSISSIHVSFNASFLLSKKVLISTFKTNTY